MFPKIFVTDSFTANESFGLDVVDQAFENLYLNHCRGRPVIGVPET